MNKPTTHYLSDYSAPDYEVESVYLTFELFPTKTRITNLMRFRQINQSEFILVGKHLSLVSIKLDGKLLDSSRYLVTNEMLSIEQLPDAFNLEIITEVSPETNTRLEGLYRTSGNYCTQCEAEGFRSMTYFLDRPDVLSFFTTKIIADKHENTVLLSNGNLLEVGDLEGDRHYAIWEDPFKKPCYLFALVAGNLAVYEDHFVTKDHRRIDLRIYVEPRNIDKCGHAMASLKKSMKWDEDRFGLIYDLDNYMIVAVDDFNMGAMENKGLNVFNSKFVLANAETATDVDYEGIEAVIGHEYFHNWTGNRVTCRDWFQLTLKEGLTVFRDQEFSADSLSRAVKRIEDVKRLRSNQFPEDKGPLSHPIQPQSYIEMNNFYTMTVYEKGAEVVRLYHTLLGEAGFQKGMALYFERHDGQAVTVEDFRDAMADANGVDLTQMHAWYVQAGTPTVKVQANYDQMTQRLTLEISQWLHGKQSHQALLIPIAFGLIASNGQEMALVPNQKTQEKLRQTEQGYLLKLTGMSETFVFENLCEQPSLSLLRRFSAPVILEYEVSFEEQTVLAKYDTDSFVRWETIQVLMMAELKKLCLSNQERVLEVSEDFLMTFELVLNQKFEDLALKALSISLPDFSFVVEQFLPLEIELIYQAYQKLKRAISKQFNQDLLKIYRELDQQKPYLYETQAIARRMLKNACLKYLGEHDASLVQKQYFAQSNMTDVWAALSTLNHLPFVEKSSVMADFFTKWHSDPLVLDKWFALQASAQDSEAVSVVKALLKHPDFSYTNPNRVRSVLGTFGRLNLVGFHIATGEGYRLLADEVIKLDKINPQVASRMIQPFTQWHQLDVKRQELMKAELQKILSEESLSKDVFEIVSKSLSS